LELLQNSTCIHPDFLAQLKSVDERRDDKIRYEDTLLGYNLQTLSIKTVAERGQFLSQYQQDARHIRDTALDNCYKELYALQKDRRRFGSDDTNSTMLYQPKRSDQILRQTSFNLEVSILAGIAKYVGFPAAPEMSALKSEETERDLQSMGVS
jgi:Sds3-like